jgi:hypothetical protein
MARSEQRLSPPGDHFGCLDRPPPLIGIYRPTYRRPRCFRRSLLLLGKVHCASRSAARGESVCAHLLSQHHRASSASESRNLSVVHRDMVSPGRSEVIKEPWHAVSVVSGSTACPAVLELRGKRVFPVDAPRLPLPGCARPNKCECVYRHHPDRRASPRRASDRGMAERGVVANRRMVTGRRSDDR